MCACCFVINWMPEPFLLLSLLVTNFIKLHNKEDPLFDRYGVDGIMPDSNSDNEDDAPSSLSSTQHQGGYGGNDDNLKN